MLAALLAAFQSWATALDLEAVRAGMAADLEAVRADLSADLAEVRGELSNHGRQRDRARQRAGAAWAGLRGGGVQPSLATPRRA